MTVSILTAVKTGWQYLPEAAASVRSQTFQDWRWLIGVNGHEPGSAAHHIARMVALDDSRIEAVDLPEAKNKPQALHALLKQTDSPLIAILDADDVWEAGKLAAQAARMESVDVLGTGGRWFGATAGTIAVKSGQVFLADLLQCNHVISSSVLMRRDCCRWPDTDGLDDYPMWLELAAAGRWIVNLPEPMVRIRCHGEQHFAGDRDNSEEIRRAWRERLAVRRGDKSVRGVPGATGEVPGVVPAGAQG